MGYGAILTLFIPGFFSGLIVFWPGLFWLLLDTLVAYFGYLGGLFDNLPSGNTGHWHLKKADKSMSKTQNCAKQTDRDRPYRGKRSASGRTEHIKTNQTLGTERTLRTEQIGANATNGANQANALNTVNRRVRF